MQDPEIDLDRLEQRDYREQVVVRMIIDVADAFCGLCDEVKLLVGDERHRRRIAFNRAPRGLEGES